MGSLIKAVTLNALAARPRSHSPPGHRPGPHRVRDLIESGSITPVIDRSYPLTDAAAAVRAVGGKPRGRSSSWFNHPAQAATPLNPQTGSG